MQKTVLISIPTSEFLSQVEERVKEALSNQLSGLLAKPVEKPITIKEVCQLLNVTEPTIHRWKKIGLIPYRQISDRIYFFESEVLAALKPMGGGKA